MNTYKTISVVIPLFNESKNINELLRRLIKVLSNFNEYEIIFINDGSTDDTLEKLLKISSSNKRIKIISLSRNFGHQIALSAGIDFISKENAVLMDGDMQDPPELIPDLINKLKQNYNVVYCVRKKRKENFIKKFCYFIFYRILKILSKVNMPLDSGDFSALDQKAITNLKKFPEKNKYIRGLRSWIGFRQTSYEYERDERHKGTPKYNFLSLTKLALDGLFSFSNFPLKIATMSGFIITFFCILYILYILINKIFIGVAPQGWSSLMIIVLFLGGLHLLVLGIIGEYIARIYDEVRGRPDYIIDFTNNI
tara:strand:- start:4401 stop:5330 length:930 start_codon:yes stop_codon:yes gene_type:complete